MSVPEATIWAQPLGQGWVPLGSDVGVEVLPESITYESNRQGGASAASFSLRRHTRHSYTDLGPFTPILIEIGGVYVWRGRIARTPKQAGEEHVWNVECEGMYAHLADDLTNTGYVHSGFGGWIDATTYPGQDVTAGTSGHFAHGATIVPPDKNYGGLTIKFPNGIVFPNNANYGVLFDAGVGNTIASVHVDLDVKSAGTDSSLTLNCRTSTDGTLSTGEANTGDSLGNCGTNGNKTATFTWNTPARYCIIYVSRTTGTTSGNDRIIRFNKILVATNKNYISSGSSTLTQSEIIKADLIAKAPLISSDHSLVADTATVVPHYWPDGWTTLRDRFESIQSFDDTQFSITNEPTPRARLRTTPSTPVWVYDASTDAGSTEDAGANDGQEMFSQALVTYQNSAGKPSDTTYTTESGSISFTNGTFDSDVANWTAGSDTTIAQATSTTYAGAGSLRLTAVGTPETVSAYTTSFSVNVIPGRTYKISCFVRLYQTPGGPQTCYVSATKSDGTGSYGAGAVDDASLTTGVWYPLTFTAVPTEGNMRVKFVNSLAWGNTFAAGVVAFLDEITIELAPDTLIDRRGFQRTIELSSDSSSSTAAAALASTYLNTAQYPPFKGSLTLTGYARKYDTGERIPVAQLPAGDALLLSDEPNPTTGALGRIGVIERIAYDHNAQTVQVDLDSRQDILDQLVLARKGSG